VECQHVFERITKFASDRGKITLLPETFNQEMVGSRGGSGENVCTRIHLRQEMEISPSTEDGDLLGLLADMQEMGFAKKFFRVRIHVEMLWEPNFTSVQYIQQGTELTFELQCKIRVSSLDVSPPSWFPRQAGTLPLPQSIFTLLVTHSRWKSMQKSSEEDGNTQKCRTGIKSFPSATVRVTNSALQF